MFNLQSVGTFFGRKQIVGQLSPACKVKATESGVEPDTRKSDDPPLDAPRPLQVAMGNRGVMPVNEDREVGCSWSLISWLI